MNLRWTRDAVALAVTAGAAYRLTRLWLRDDFPPVVAIRNAVIARLQPAEPDDPPEPWAPAVEHPLLPLTYCPWCAGFWITAAVVAVASTPALAPLWKPLSTTLAISAVVGLASAHDE